MPLFTIIPNHIDILLLCYVMCHLHMQCKQTNKSCHVIESFNCDTE